jgi:hypothetical protein
MLPIECVLLYTYKYRSVGFRIKTEVHCVFCFIHAVVIFLLCNIPFAGDCCSSFTLSSVGDKFYQNYIAGSWSLSTVISTYNGRWDNCIQSSPYWDLVLFKHIVWQQILLFLCLLITMPPPFPSPTAIYRWCRTWYLWCSSIYSHNGHSRVSQILFILGCWKVWPIVKGIKEF